MIDLMLLEQVPSPRLLNVTVGIAELELFQREWEAAFANASRRSQLDTAPCNAMDLYQQWSGLTLTAASDKGVASELVNKGADKCVAEELSGGGGGHHHWMPAALQIGRPCAAGFRYFPGNGSLWHGTGTGHQCVDINDGQGPVGQFQCHSAGDPDVEHQQFEFDRATGLLRTKVSHGSGGGCVTVVANPNPQIDAVGSWARLRAGIPARAFVVPVSPRGCEDIDVCVGMEAGSGVAGKLGDCVCATGAGP
jgi:hypothetical protein